MSDNQDRPGTHITVEVLTPAEVKRLEGRINGLHDTIFKYFERVSQLKNR